MSFKKSIAIVASLCCFSFSAQAGFDYDACMARAKNYLDAKGKELAEMNQRADAKCIEQNKNKPEASAELKKCLLQAKSYYNNLMGDAYLFYAEEERLCSEGRLYSGHNSYSDPVEPVYFPE